MTPQEIFDTVAEHLLTQRRQSYSDGVCKYRSGNLKCAVGVLIPDEKYNPRMEGLTANELLARWKSSLAHLAEHADLLHDLQVVHDGIGIDEAGRYKVSDMRGRLIIVANLHDLEWNF